MPKFYVKTLVEQISKKGDEVNIFTIYRKELIPSKKKKEIILSLKENNINFHDYISNNIFIS